MTDQAAPNSPRLRLVQHSGSATLDVVPLRGGDLTIAIDVAAGALMVALPPKDIAQLRDYLNAHLESTDA